MKWLDGITENRTRELASRTSRRSFIGRLAGLLAGGAATIPLLPVARGQQAGQQPEEVGDPYSCEYWRYCAIDGFLCACCGGTMTSCPPGTEMSPLTWIGTCENPVDQTRYIISYNDCCGKSSCGNCLCQRNIRERPIYRPQDSADLNWCLGTTTNSYHCTLSIVVGTALDE